MSRQETAPLLGSNGNGGGSGSGRAYYFNQSEKSDSGKYQSVSDADGGQVVESLPQGASAQDFEPRTIGTGIKVSIKKIYEWDEKFVFEVSADSFHELLLHSISDTMFSFSTNIPEGKEFA